MHALLEKLLHNQRKTFKCKYVEGRPHRYSGFHQLGTNIFSQKCHIRLKYGKIVPPKFFCYVVAPFNALEAKFGWLNN